MRHIKRLICIVVWNSLTLASIANAQTEQNKEADSRVIKQCSAIRNT
jgi:Ni/Co efflux regulator RcnB